MKEFESCLLDLFYVFWSRLAERDSPCKWLGIRVCERPQARRFSPRSFRWSSLSFRWPWCGPAGATNRGTIPPFTSMPKWGLVRRRFCSLLSGGIPGRDPEIGCCGGFFFGDCRTDGGGAHLGFHW